MSLLKYKDQQGNWHSVGIQQPIDNIPTENSPHAVSSGGVYDALKNGGLPYSTTAPTSNNTDGIKIVVLSSEPSTKYSGWLYIITG